MRVPRPSPPVLRCGFQAGLIVAAAMAAPQRTEAHSLLVSYVEHRITLSADPHNIDIHAELTFHDMASLLERRRMDLDRDGVITRREARAYSTRMASVLADAIGVRVGDKELTVAMLHDPELDLVGERSATAMRHVLRLTYFVRTPAGRPRGTLTLDDQLWPRVAADCSLETEGASGWKWTAPPPRQQIWLTGPSAEARILNLPYQLTPEIPHAPTSRPASDPALRPRPADRSSGTR